MTCCGPLLYYSHNNKEDISLSGSAQTHWQSLIASQSGQEIAVGVLVSEASAAGVETGEQLFHYADEQECPHSITVERRLFGRKQVRGTAGASFLSALKFVTLSREKSGSEQRRFVEVIGVSYSVAPSPTDLGSGLFSRIAHQFLGI
jgi:hypothetical protein